MNETAVQEGESSEEPMKPMPPSHSFPLETSVFEVTGGALHSGRPSKESILQRLADALMRRSLTKIDLSQRGLQASDARLVCMALKQNEQLSVLKLGYNNIGDKGVTLLASGIREHKHLESLDLGFNNIGDKGCATLCLAIPGEGRLRTLYLAGNLIGEDGAFSIADLLQRCRTIKKLYLTGNKLGPDGVKALMDTIAHEEARCDLDANQDSRFLADHGEEKSASSSCETQCIGINRGMEELFLGGTGMTSIGCASVATLASITTHLRVLSLPNCDITDDSLALISASIKKNKEKIPLESLQLSFNRISCRGIEKLANAIWGSATIKELFLDNNEIADRGAQHISVIIPDLKSLEKLDLGFNNIKAPGIKVLMTAVIDCRSLQTLSISGNKIDASAAKSIGYTLAVNHSLVSLFLMHCSINHDGQRQIVAGIVSNSCIVLRELTGFEIGPIVGTLGFPTALQHWNNEKILNFIHMMWSDTADGDAVHCEEKEIDPLHFLDDGLATRPPPQDAAVVVEVAKKAFSKLVENGVDVFSRRPDYPGALTYDSPIPEEGFVVETDQRPEESALAGNNAMITARSFVVEPESNPGKTCDPSRKKRIVEWLCSNIQHLNKLAEIPFNSAELWRLHQHYFTPVVNESGGILSCRSPLPSSVPVALAVSSVPEVSKICSPHGNSLESHDCGSWQVAASEPSMKASPKMASLSMLKRKVSYRSLGDAILTANTRLESRPTESISMMISGGPTGHSLPPRTKRARRNRSRISFLPKIKAKLDSYLDVCHEKALITMRQLLFVERAILAGEVNPIDRTKPPKMHLSGSEAADAETIIVDMI